MEVAIIIIVVVIVAVGFVVMNFFPDAFNKAYEFGKGLWDRITGMFSSKQGFADYSEDEPLGPSIDTKLKTAESRVMEAVTGIISNYGIPTREDMDELSHELDVVDEKIKQKVMGEKNPDEMLAIVAPELLIGKAAKVAEKVIFKMGCPEGAKMAKNDIMMKLKPEIHDILNFNVSKNKMSVSNLLSTQDDIRKRIGGDNIFQAIWQDQTGKNFMNAREVAPLERRMKNQKIDLTKATSNNVINVLTADNPSLFNNNQLLPNLAPKDLNQQPVNMELANIIASQNRWYEDGSHNVVRNRGGDTRPLPKALIDSIMMQGNTRDPNSLQMATKYDLIDVLETGRGDAGNEYLDKAIDTFYRANNSDFIKETEIIASHNLRKSGSLRNGRTTENSIISDIKNGKMKGEILDMY